MAQESLERLIALLNLSGKRDVTRHCKNLIIRSEDLADLLMTGSIAGIGPYRYANHFAELRHADLEPTESQLKALATSGIGIAKGDALKAINKMDQMFLQRRLLAVHLFYMPSHKYWHMFYFDQRDYDSDRNHWKHGPHIHYSQDTFTRAPLSDVWRMATTSPPSFPPAVHVRYDYHHNRKRRA